MDEIRAFLASGKRLTTRVAIAGPTRDNRRSMDYTIEIDRLSAPEWGALARDFRDYTIYQTPAYQDVRAARESQRVSQAVVRNARNEPVLMCVVRIRTVPILGLRIGYVQWGPLHNHLRTGRCVARDAWALLRSSYVPEIVDVLRIVPNLDDDEQAVPVIEGFRNGGFTPVPSVPAYRTLYVRVDDEPDAIRNRLHRSWRKVLRRVERSDLQIEEGTEIRHFDILESIYQAAKERKGFAGLDSEVFVETQQKLEDSDKMHTIVAYADGEPVCIHTSSYLGDMGQGILAGSTEAGLSMKASYLVWWRTFLAAHRAGMRVYDLGGIDPDVNPTVYQFKVRMGGYEVLHAGAFDAVRSARHGLLWRGIEKAYRTIRA